MAVVLIRPGRLDIHGHPGNDHSFNLAWPTSIDTGHAWSATLDRPTAPIGVTADGQTMTLTVSGEVSADATEVRSWRLMDGDQDVIVGLWVPSTDGTVSPTGTVQVVDHDGTAVTVTVIGTGGGGGGGGSVDTVNGQPGPVVVLDADDVQADPAGAADAVAASLAAIATSGQYADLLGAPAIPAAPGDIGAEPAGTASTAVAALAATLATVATTGQYSSLAGRPVLAAVATSGLYADLAGRPALAPVATSGSYPDLTGRPALATVATSGSYTDLSSRPAFAAVATSGSYGDLSGRPSLAAVATSGAYGDLANRPDIASYLVPRTGYTSGEWTSCALTGASTTLVSYAANVLRFAPFRPIVNMTADRMRFYVAAAANVRAGIYASDGTNGAPGTRLVDAGVAAVAVAGDQTLTTSLAMTGGVLYWLVVQNDVTVNMRTHTEATMAVLEPNAPSVATNNVTWTANQFYVNGLPATASGLIKSTLVPAVQLRVA